MFYKYGADKKYKHNLRQRHRSLVSSKPSHLQSALAIPILQYIFNTSWNL